MRKIVIIIVAVLVLGGSAGAYYILNKSDEKKPVASSSAETSPKEATPTSTAAPPPAKPVAQKKACDLLTADIANKLLGSAPKPAGTNSDAPNDANNVIITTCTYSSADGAKTASLLRREAKNAEGSEHDKEQYGPNKPATAQTIPGYGDSAYWDADFRQLNILKGNIWYVLTNGSVETSARTLDQAKQMADFLISKL